MKKTTKKGATADTESSQVNLTDAHPDITLWLEARKKRIAFLRRCMKAIRVGRVIPSDPETGWSLKDLVELEQKAADAWFATLSPTQRAVLITFLDDGARVGISHLRDRHVHSRPFFKLNNSAD